MKNMAASLIVMLAALSVGTGASYVDPHMVGNRQAMVFLMGWRWADIAKECESYLGPKGFGGVEIMPANEHAVDIKEAKRTWYEQYQPVSYKLESVSGNEDKLRDMVKRCNEVGVRVFADVVINHMAPNEYPSIGKGSAGSYYDMSTFSYPAVPYAAEDFSVHNLGCPSKSGKVEDFGEASEVRNCNVHGFPDLDMSVPHVRISIADYLNKLIDIGVAGFFVVKAENMWPDDLEIIFHSLNDLNQDYFEPGVRPFISQRVWAAEGFPIKPSEYFNTGRVTEFAYSRAVSEAVRGTGKMASLENVEVDFNLMPSTNALVFVDGPILQRSHLSSSAHQSISFEEPGLSTRANAFMLAYPYGLTRIMSSYVFTDESDGPLTLSPVINVDGSCSGGWVCEHRWVRNRNLVGFQNASAGQPLANFWSNGNQQIAFGRGDKAFIAFNNEDKPFFYKLPTGLPEGKYCDVYNGEFDPQSCTCSGPLVIVDEAGYALFKLDNPDTQVIAIHTNALVKDVTGKSDPVSTTAPTTPKSTTNTQSSTSSQVHTSTKVAKEHGSGDLPEAVSKTPTVEPTQVPTTTKVAKEQGSGELPEAVTEKPTMEPTQVPTTTKAAKERGSGELPEAVTKKPTTEPTQVPTTTKAAKERGSGELPEAVTEKPTMEPTKVPTTTKAAKERGSGELPEAVTKKPTIEPTQVPTTTKAAKERGSGELPEAVPKESTVEPTEAPTTTKAAKEQGSGELPEAVTIKPTVVVVTDATTQTPMNRTIIFIHKETAFGQFMFLRGGVSHDIRSGCTVNAHTSACAIPIRHHAQPENQYFTAWQTGDNFLDWYGAEEGQGAYDQGGVHVQAGGTPMIWTTNNPSYGLEVSVNGYGYTPLNQWGDHYWMADLEVDCSKTEDGWFEMKGFLTNAGNLGWESDVSQEQNCGGSAGGSRPRSSNNHFARCGFVNVVKFGQNECIIDTLN